jgi:hypothetical protein
VKWTAIFLGTSSIGRDRAPIASPGRLPAKAWDEPYLETCCRSALHRVWLAGEFGRPAGMKDGPCLERHLPRGFVARRADGRYVLTPAGAARHRTEILRMAVPQAPSSPSRREQDVPNPTCA